MELLYALTFLYTHLCKEPICKTIYFMFMNINLKLNKCLSFVCKIKVSIMLKLQIRRGKQICMCVKTEPHINFSNTENVFI